MRIEIADLVITEITRINTVTPSITPRTEINVMIDRNVRFGFKYRSARKTLNGRFNSVSVAANSLRFNCARHPISLRVPLVLPA